MVTMICFLAKEFYADPIVHVLSGTQIKCQVPLRGLDGIVKLRTAERSWAGRQASPSFFKAHTSPLSSQRTLGPGGVDGELL